MTTRDRVDGYRWAMDRLARGVYTPQQLRNLLENPDSRGIITKHWKSGLLKAITDYERKQAEEKKE